MRHLFTKLLAISFLSLFTFSMSTAQETKKNISTEKSKVQWKGYKVTGSHEGLISIKSGHLDFDEGELVGGTFVIDMPSLSVTDLQGEYKDKLEGHLKSDDFFGTSTHKEASLVITKVLPQGKNSYSVTGDLMIKGKKEPITFGMSIYGSKATANLKIDRTKYDVKYGSASFFDGLKDKAIYDEFDIVADLEF